MGSRPASFEAVRQGFPRIPGRFGHHSLREFAPIEEGDGPTSLAKVHVNPSPGQEYVSPFAAMDPLAPFPSTVLSGGPIFGCSQQAQFLDLWHANFPNLVYLITVLPAACGIRTVISNNLEAAPAPTLP